jgi:hypothetical protein
MGIILAEELPNLAQLHENILRWIAWLGALEVPVSSCCTTAASVIAGTIPTGCPGRPPLDLPKEKLEYLRDAGFNWVQVAKMFGVSRSAVMTRVAQHGLQRSVNYFTDISDGDLRAQVQEIQQRYRHAGCRMVRGILVSQGIRVSLARVHSCLRALDPISSSERWGALIRRRRYRVKGANSLWHLALWNRATVERCIPGRQSNLLQFLLLAGRKWSHGPRQQCGRPLFAADLPSEN